MARIAGVMSMLHTRYSGSAIAEQPFFSSTAAAATKTVAAAGKRHSRSLGFN